MISWMNELDYIKMKFFFKDFFSKWEKIRRKLQIWSHLLKQILMENFTFVQSYSCVRV